MLNRKIDSYIANHYEQNHKALFVTGARQVGKSFAIQKYARSKFKHFYEFNFYKEPEIIPLVESAKDEKDLLSKLALYRHTSFVEDETFIFFDEVEKYPDLLTWVKFLVQDGRFKYAISGSLLGVELKGVRSWPVGYMDEIQLYPMDFEEFVMALGVSENVISQLRDCYEMRNSVDEYVHRKMMELFHLYLIVGGMPEAVQTFVDTHDFVKVRKVQSNILKFYRRDVGEYNTGRQLEINEIFKLIPSELNAQNKRFVFTNLKDASRFRERNTDFLWLAQADMALPTFNVDSPTYPLKQKEKRNLFKLFQNDVGLLCCQYVDGIPLKLMQGDVNLNYGSIYENAVAEELHGHGWELRYFCGKKQGELDFLLENDAKIIPVEVKSGKDYERHNALTNVLKNPEYNISEAFVFCNDNLQVKGKITYLPIYMVMFFYKNKKIESQIYAVNIDGLK